MSDQVDATNRVLRERGVLPPSGGDAGPQRRPLTRFEKKTGGRIPLDNSDATPPPSSPFDPISIVEEMKLYRLEGADSYFMLEQNGDGARYAEFSSKDITRTLRTLEYRNRPDAEAGQKASQIDLILEAARKHHSVDAAIRLSGWDAGIYHMAGRRILVRESPKAARTESRRM